MFGEWKQRFEETGEVEVCVSRRGASIGLAIGLVMFALSMVLVLMPGSRYPLLLVRTIGWTGAVFCGVGLIVAVRFLLVPPVLLRLDQRTVTARYLPPATWGEVLGASTMQNGGWTYTTLLLAPTFWARAEPRGLRERLHRFRATAGAGQGEGLVGPAILGGADDLTRLVLWARQRVGVSER